MTESKAAVPVWLAVPIAFSLIALSAYRTYMQAAVGFFDDAFMFYRYALNLRHGLGWSWNPDGVHTYGMTSLTWQLVVLFFSFFFKNPTNGLIFASTLTYCVASCLLAWYVVKRSTSAILRQYGNALLLVALPLEMETAFRAHVSNGMDTMLGFLFSAALACMSFELTRRSGKGLAVCTGIVAYLSIATRPESALCAFFVPILVLFLVTHKGALQRASIHAGTTLALVAVQLLLASKYFTTAVPLAFYLKAKHAYVGFIGYDGSSQQVTDMLSMVWAYLLILLLCAGKGTVKCVLALLIPVMVTVLYLTTVLQIMGGYGRYYAPYIPYVIVAAWVVLDRALSSERVLQVSWVRATVVALCLTAGTTSNAKYAVAFAQKKYVATHPGLPVPSLRPKAVPPLPQIGSDIAFHKMCTVVAGRLPAGSSMAASEVGILGIAAPKVNILDLVGLNSRDMTMSGLSPDVLFKHNPDVIWMPHTDYTGLYGAIVRDPRLLQRYDFIPEAFLYGVAVRKDSPQHDAVLNNIASVWPQMYPNTKLQDYIVRTP